MVLHWVDMKEQPQRSWSDLTTNTSASICTWKFKVDSVSNCGASFIDAIKATETTLQSHCWYTWSASSLHPALTKLQLRTHIWNHGRSPGEMLLYSRSVVFESEIIVQEDVCDNRFLDVRSIESSRTGRSKNGLACMVASGTRKVKSHQARLPYPHMGNFASTSVSLATEPVLESSTKR